MTVLRPVRHPRAVVAAGIRGVVIPVILPAVVRGTPPAMTAVAAERRRSVR